MDQDQHKHTSKKNNSNTNIGSWFQQINPIRLIILLILIMALLISVCEIAKYFINSHNNRVMQQQLAQEHQLALVQEQQNATQIVEPTQTIEPVQTVTPIVTQNQSVIATDVLNTQPTITATPQIKRFFLLDGITRESLRSFIKKNSDTIGWITIEGIVDQPVVYRDNEYYLDHDYTKKSNVCGAIFLDENHPLETDSQNVLLYGHNMKDESMFGKFHDYLEGNYLHNNYMVTFETKFRSYQYIIFAVDLVSTDQRDANYLCFWGHSTFYNQNVFDQYIAEIYENSEYTEYIDVNYSDTILTLATCHDDERLVLFARRLRDGETQEYIEQKLMGLYRK